MCEINPKRKSIFRLEFFTSDSRLSEQEWREMVLERILELEMKFNESGEIRVHVHEVHDENWTQDISNFIGENG